MKTILAIIAIIGAMLSNPKNPKNVSDVCKTQLYAMGATVVNVQSVDKEMEKVTIENCNGQEYAFFTDIGDYEVGDNVSAIMCDMGTKTVLDDVIITARYDRYDLLP